MKTFNTYYKDAEQFRLFVETNAIKDTPQLLVQIFCAFSDVEIIQAIMNVVSGMLPSCHIIGATTDGEILGANVHIHTVVISLTLFEHTTLQSYGMERQSDCKQLGNAMAQTLIQEDTRAVITFVDGISTNGEEYLEGFALAHNVTVAGGLAGDLSKFGKTYVFTKELITCNGAVGVALNNPTLHVYSDYNFNWSSIGKEMTITHAEKNRVYTIDHKTAIETYANYLGDEVAAMIPNIGIEFPLMLSRNGISVARAAVAKNSDGSITFAGNLKTGDKVRLGFGNAELILNDAMKSLERVDANPIESIFIYACMARRRFLQEAIGLEIEPWTQIAPVCGFFTYGEFFSTPTAKLLFNQTMTILALSEGGSVMSRKPIPCTKPISRQMVDFANTCKALSHFINKTTEELVESNEKLKDT
ncbi:FIST signal transduction protein [Sulfurospirillum arsenophilum]|uniref:FIST signal transduction protein n=1 Tax=Sulfurospirillum arsenophilum TaxID=56698 RepID=UPI000694BA6E|nr:FIST N-terminal domain-containing protein [Sulfurospirillum arsenophilum]